jgi:hypothetical protein
MKSVKSSAGYSGCFYNTVQNDLHKRISRVGSRPHPRPVAKGKSVKPADDMYVVGFYSNP